jgi:hypothetical protein
MGITNSDTHYENLIDGFHSVRIGSMRTLKGMKTWKKYENLKNIKKSMSIFSLAFRFRL